MKTYNETELKQLLQDVETEITSLVKGEQTKLAKAHPGEETAAEVPADESATATAPSDDSGPPASAAPASPPPSDGPPPDASAGPPPDASAAPPGPADGSDPAADQSADPAALEAEYSKLPPEDLKAHYLACKSALYALMGGAGADPGMDPGADAGAPPPSAPPAPPPASPSAPPALKGEMKSDVAANGENPLHKAQSEAIAALTKKLKESDEVQTALLGVVEKLANAPVRKAITSVAHLKKTDEGSDVSQLSRDEVKIRLKRAAQRDLKKSDRDLIYGFDFGSVNVEQVAHLLRDAK